MDRREEILKIFPGELRILLGQALKGRDFETLQEIRLRIGKPLLIKMENREYFLETVTAAQMRETVEYMSSFSLYAAEEELRRGFLTIQGGHRIGVAGRTVTKGQEVSLMKFISFLNVRVAHEITGCGDRVMPYLYEGDRF